MIRKALIAFAVAALAATGVALVVPNASAAPTGFVSRSGAQFVLNGAPYRFAGTNNYYLHYKSALMVDDVFADAQAMGLTVMRAWTFLECGGAKPNSAGGCSAGVDNWMQRWSATTNTVEYNEGPGGLPLLDKMIASAAAHNVRLLLPFTGNWKDFGGMDQYVTWFGGQFHDEFYTNPSIKQAYKNWISKLLNRTNTITGVKYKDDPTIFSWELANEPRCINASLPTSGTCTADTLTTWAGEMSTYVKSLDANHMVSVGDEGFLNRNGNGTGSWPYNATDGVDHERLTALPNIDFGTYHLYPSGWGQTNAWGTTWITDHNAVGTTLNKPEVLEEFGIADQSARTQVYTDWTNAVRTGGGDGWMFWILTGVQDDGSLYPDYDGFRVTYPSDIATLLSTQAAQISAGGGPTPTTTPTRTATPTASPTASRTPTPTPTVSLSLSPSPSRTPTPPVTGACTVTYKIANQWPGGFQGDVTVRTGVAVNGWTLKWSFANGQVISQLWNGNVTSSGAAVTVTNAAWNGSLPANGSTNMGFIASWNGANAAPTAFSLNGTTCAAG